MALYLYSQKAYLTLLQIFGCLGKKPQAAFEGESRQERRGPTLEAQVSGLHGDQSPLATLEASTAIGAPGQGSNT